MAVLLHLVAHHGQVISREELLDAVWPGIHVGDDSLTAAIIKIRRALGDDARNPIHIETIPKRGYRLISPISATEATATTEPPPTSGSKPRSSSYRRLPVLVLLLGLLGIVSYYGSISKDRVTEQPSPVDTSTVIAVTPFANVSGDPEQNYLALGISDSILDDLTRQSGLSVRQMLAGAVPATPADYVLQGSVVRFDGRLRVVARLLDGDDGEVLKALKFDRNFHDVLSIEDEIRDIVITEIAGSITAEEKSRRARGYTENVAAYDLFLKAQSQLLVRTAATNSAAQGLYRQAIAADESFARAYGGLALSYAAEYRNGWVNDGDAALDNAMKFARTAIGISPDLPEQHWVIGYVSTQQRQYDEAERHLKLAIDIAPGFADAYALLGGIETYRGKPEGTVPLLRDALRLSPNAGYLYFLLLARAYYFLGDFEQAHINLNETLERNPENVEARLYLAATLLHLDRANDAEWEEMEVLGIEPDFNLDAWSKTYPMVRGEQLDRLLADLRLAGFS
ncbi:MAG: winged helix-turn-helix domain-containing protein [Paracoccaceae bacterium]